MPNKSDMHKAYPLKSTGEIMQKICVGDIYTNTKLGRVGVSNNKITIRFELEGSVVEVPYLSPLSGKRASAIEFDENLILVYHDSSWPEFSNVLCGAGVILVKDNQLVNLPDVKPETFVYQDKLGQLIVGQVEKSPFNTPCAALLDTGNSAAGYLFPTEEPIIVESCATTVSNHVHESVCMPGTGSSYGNVPFIYPWQSPDGKRHGWAAAIFLEWEVVGMEKPTDEKESLEAREVAYDSLEVNEEYYLFLGPKEDRQDLTKKIRFKILHRAMDGGCYYRKWMEDLARKDKNKKQGR